MAALSAFYEEDLAYVHDTGFGGFARDAAPGLLAMLHAAGIAGGLVVDLGCGSGIWARALRDAGYDVFGVDASAAMIALALAAAPGARFAAASLYDVEMPPCAAVTAIGEGFTYLGAADPAAALPALFTRIFARLAPGGLLVFDVILRNRVRPQAYAGVLTGPDWRLELRVDENPDAALLTRHIAITRQVDGGERRSEEVHRVRTFDQEALAGRLAAAGFDATTQTAYGAMALAPNRVAFTARKPR